MQLKQVQNNFRIMGHDMYVVKTSPPFYKKLDVTFKLGPARDRDEVIENTKTALKTNLETKLGAEWVELSGFDDRYKNFSSSQLMVNVGNGVMVPVDVIYHASKVYSSNQEIPEISSLSGMTIEAAKNNAASLARQNNNLLKGYSLLVNGQRFNFALTPADAFYNFLYMLAISQQGRFDEVKRLIYGRKVFSDMSTASHAPQSRSLAMLTGILNSDISDSFSQIFQPNKTLTDHLQQNSYSSFLELVYGIGRRAGGVEEEGNDERMIFFSGP